MRARWLALAVAGGCAPTIEGPTPTLTGVSPGVACNDQLVSTRTVSGTELAPATTNALTDAPTLVLPALSLVPATALDGDAASGDPVALGGDDAAGRVRWLDASTMTFDVRAELALAPGVWSLAVSNLQGAAATRVETLAIVPPPVADGFTPAIVCIEQEPQQVVVAGQGFVEVDGVGPTLEIGGLSLPVVALDGCAPIEGANLDVTLRSCTSATFELPQGSLAPAVYDAVVRNPEPAACGSTSTLRLEVVPPPSLDAVAPALVCNDQGDEAIVATGSGFLELDSARPTVRIGTWTGLADSVSDCVSLLGPAGGESCTTLDVTVPEGSLDEGVLDVVITNPAPPDCSTEEPVQIENVPPPTVTGLGRPSVCVDAPDTELVVEGFGFVVLADGAEPTVALGGVDAPVLAVDGCASLLGPAGGETCTAITVLVASTAFDTPGSYAVVVTNPAPADCESGAGVALEITPPPTITAIDPGVVCSTGGEIVIEGTGFATDAEVLIAGVPAQGVRWVDSTQLVVDAPGALPGGFVDVEVRNPDGCSATGEDAIEVVAGPVLFFVDPPVLYGGVDTPATLFVGGITGAVTGVEIVDADGTAYPLPDYAWDGGNLVAATIPADSLGLGDGTYTVRLTDDTACRPFLEDAVRVRSDLTVSITRVEPAFGWNGSATPVRVRGATPLPSGEVGFTDLPRVYLFPSDEGDSDLARGLRSVTYVAGDRLDAVVPAGLAPGDGPVAYDVVVVNPDGTIGLLPRGFTATVLPPPVVSSASPSRLPANSVGALRVLGRDFRSPTVDLVCRQPGGVVVTRPTTFVASTSTTIDVQANPGPEGSVCVVRVTNGDGTTGEFASISARSASGNLFGFRLGEGLGTPRRAPGSVVGEVTTVSRYLYAIGGDDGTVAGALATVERASVDPFGDPSGWVELPGELPEPRSFAGSAVAGRFAYLVGGHDGVTPVDTIWRAEVLDPLAAPAFDDLGIAFAGTNGLGGGTWTYRIAARFAPTDARNPGGEGLASDPIVVRLPDVPGGLSLSLSWTPVPRAVGYRVYRTPTSDAGSGTERWVGDVAGTTFVDAGRTADPAQAPLPAGALGVWHEVGRLPGTNAAEAAREAPGVAVVEDPADPTLVHLVVAGGRDALGDDRDTVSVITIDLADPDEGVLAVEESDVTLTRPRRALAAMTVDTRFHTVVDPGEAWVYWVGGFDGTSAVGTAEAARVNAGGVLGAYSDALVDDVSPGRAGMAFGAAGDFLFLLGGQSGSPTTSGREAEIVGPPDIENWNSLGGSGITIARLYPGSAQDDAVLFVVGGTTGTAAASTAVELANF